MPIEVGKTYFIRCTPMDYVGRVIAVDGLHVEMVEASWIAESGRFGEFLRNGSSPNMEIEFIGEWGTKFHSWKEWKHPLFKEST